MQTDVLILGSGIGGLSTAIQIALRRPDLKITVLTKTQEGESNTRYAQGGVAAVWNGETDSFEKHRKEDTLDAGDGWRDEKIVEIVVKEGPERVREIIEWGARFDKKQDLYDLGREGGHSEKPDFALQDLTGGTQRSLMEKADTLPNIEVLEQYFAVDVITQHHLGYTVTRLMPDIECYGLYALNKHTNEIEKFLAKVTIIATGGTGQVYRNTTNPVIATGDGIAMVYRAKGVENMEFVQFHPTVLVQPGRRQSGFSGFGRRCGALVAF